MKHTIQDLLDSLRALDPETAAAEEIRLIEILKLKIRSIQTQRMLIERLKLLKEQFKAVRAAGSVVDNPAIMDMAASIRDQIRDVTEELADPTSRHEFLHRLVALSSDPLYTVKNLIIEFGPTGRIKATDLKGKKIFDTAVDVVVPKETVSEAMQEFAALYAQHDELDKKLAAKFSVSERLARAAIVLSKRQLNNTHIAWAKEFGRGLNDKVFMRKAKDRFVIGNDLAKLLLERFKEILRVERGDPPRRIKRK